MISIRQISSFLAIGVFIATTIGSAQSIVTPEEVQHLKEDFERAQDQAMQSELILISVLYSNYGIDGAFRDYVFLEYDDTQPVKLLTTSYTDVDDLNTLRLSYVQASFDDGQESFEQIKYPNSRGELVEGSSNYFYDEPQSRGYRYAYYWFDLETGDTVRTTLGRVDTMPDLQLAGADYVVLNQQFENGLYVPFNEQFGTNAERSSPYWLRGVRIWDPITSTWSDGDYISETIRGDYVGGNYTQLDSSWSSIDRSEPSVSQIVESTVTRDVDFAGTREDYFKYRTLRGTTLEYDRSVLLEMDFMDNVTYSFQSFYAWDSTTQQRSSALSYLEEDFEYVPGYSFLSSCKRQVADSSAVFYTTNTAVYNYIRVIDVDDVSFEDSGRACIEETLVDPDKLILSLDQSFGKGEVALLSLDGRVISQGSLNGQDQISIERPEKSGIYVLSYSGERVACSQKVFVP